MRLAAQLPDAALSRQETTAADVLYLCVNAYLGAGGEYAPHHHGARTRTPGDLDGGRRDASGGARDQHRFALRQTAALRQCPPRGLVRQRGRGCDPEVEGLRDPV